MSHLVSWSLVRKLIHYAAQAGNSGAVRALLDHGANPRVPDCNGKIPLEYAGGSQEIIGFLREAGERAEQAEQEVQETRIPELIEPLRDIRNILRTRVSNNGFLPIQSAAYSGDAATLAMLIDENPELISIKTASKITLLHLAALSGSKEAIGCLFTKGARVTAQDTEGRTPLVYACATGASEEVIQKLIHEEMGASCIIRKSERFEGMTEAEFLASRYAQWPLLNYAACSGNQYLVDTCLEAGCFGVNQRYKDITPLEWAAYRGNNGMVTQLLEAGAQINSRDTKGLTPLYLACYKGHSSTVNLLAEHGANFRLAQSNNMNPLHSAVNNGHLGLVSMLVEKHSRAIKKASTLPAYGSYRPIDIARKYQELAEAAGNEDRAQLFRRIAEELRKLEV